MSSSQNKILDLIRAGDRRAVARAISAVENQEDDSRELLRDVFPFTGNGYRIGITGPPGAGKSTLTNRMAKHYRQKGLKVGIIAVDPTSPFTGGALLGDRIRMTDVEMDDGVFIRSMASRGSLGGLSMKAKEAADILDAAGHDIILLETVGVGQSELDIAAAADTTIVVLVPESGDGIQAMKAGLMEIADILVMNKSDRPGAEQAVLSIKLALGFKKPVEHSSSDSENWTPEVIQTNANEGKGISEVVNAVDLHRNTIETNKGLEAKRKSRLEKRVKELIDETLHVDFWSHDRQKLLRNELQSIFERHLTPYDLASKLIKDFREKS